MRSSRPVQLGALALALIGISWLVFRGDEDAAERARLAAEAAAAAAKAGSMPAQARSERAGSARALPRAGEREAQRSDSAFDAKVGEVERRLRAMDEADGASIDPHGKSQVLPIHLDRLAVEADRPVVEINGLDPEAPRELIAWRIKDGKAAILVRGESDEFGQLDFPPVVAAGSGLEVVITGVDGHPDLPGASDVRKLAPRSPEPPQGRVLDAYEGEAVVRILPTEGSGTVLLADGDGTVFARYPIPLTPPIGTRVFDVVLELAGDVSQLLMAHEFTDGRRSDWRALDVGATTELVEDPGFGDFAD